MLLRQKKKDYVANYINDMTDGLKSMATGNI